MANVSVVMATYNGERHLAAQLDSILRQTLRPHELFISDDGSTDTTRRIVSSFAERASFPVRVRLNSDRLGYADNFLTAAKLCEGRYVAFCDQDDVWHPEKLDLCVAALEREEALLCVHPATLIDENSLYLGYFPQGITESQVYPALTLPPWEVFFGFSQVFRRDILDLVELTDRGLDNHTLQTPVSHDRWVYFLAQSLGKTVTIARPLARYRQHGANAYGGLRKGLPERLRGKLNGSADTLRAYMAISLHRARLMADLHAEKRPWALAEQARLASLYWSELAESYRRRVTLYEAGSSTQRLAMLKEMTKAGIYAPPQDGGLGKTLLIKDFALGVLRLPISPNRKGGKNASASPVAAEEPR